MKPLTLTFAALVTALVGCTPKVVTPNAVVRQTAHRAEGTWHDLEAHSAVGGQEGVMAVFSRRYLLRASGVDTAQTTYETNYEAYEKQLADMNTRIAANKPAIGELATRVIKRVTAMLERGPVFTGAATESISFRDRQTLRPSGPNTATFQLSWWAQGMGRGEPVIINVLCVQEHEGWRIDRMTPDPFDSAGTFLAEHLSKPSGS